MGGLSDWFKALLAKLNIHADPALLAKETEYADAGELKKENYLIVELGAYIHAKIETLSCDTMEKLFTEMGNQAAEECANRPHLREVYILADDPFKVPLNKARRTGGKVKTSKLLTPAKEAFEVARMKKLLTMPMPMGQRDAIKRELGGIGLGSTDQDREALLNTPTTRMLLEIGLARIWLYHVCEAAFLSGKSETLLINIEGIACPRPEQLQSLINSDFSVTMMTEVMKMDGLRDRREALVKDLIDNDTALRSMAPAYSGSNIDYPGESDHKIFPIITHPIHRDPADERPAHYGVITSDYDIPICILMNFPRIIMTLDCKQCDGCREGTKCLFKNTITREVTVHMKTHYARFKKGKDGEMIEVEEPRRALKMVPLYRAIYTALRAKPEFKWIAHPLNTIVFLFLLCASDTDFCNGLPGIGPAAVFDELVDVSKVARLHKEYSDMVTVEPLTYIGTPRSIVTPIVNLDKIRSFIIRIYCKKHKTLLEEKNVTFDPRTKQPTLDQIFTADTAAHKRILSINEKGFKVVLANAIWNLRYIFNGFVDATEYRSNCVELDPSGQPKYGWKVKGDGLFVAGAGHSVNSAMITNDHQ